MIIDTIKTRLEESSIYLGNTEIGGRQTETGYEKKFRWAWFATQLNTFILAPDFRGETVTVPSMEAFLTDGFAYAKKNYKGWPRGLQSGLAVIAIFVADDFNDEAIEYCVKLKAGKKFAGFTIPVAANSATGTVTYFEKKPIWGKIYYPHIENLIKKVTS